MIWNRFFSTFLLAACGLVLVAAVFFGVVRHTLDLGALSQEPQYLYIENGDSLRGIARKARDLGLVQRSWHFVLAARLLGQETQLRAGEYSINPRAGLRDIITKIAAGDVHYRKVLVPEGMSVAQVESILLAAPGLVWDGYEPPVEGSLLPETYYFTRNEKVSALILRMQENLQRELDMLWENRAADLPFDTKEEALILASIVEKETGQAIERPLVAAVFTNRLKRGMRLQSDPTVVYGITMGEPLGRRLTLADLKQDTGYNTYRTGGLPPTAIANPGLGSIVAVLSPAAVKYLYFVADGTGGHAFATSLKEHNRNVARWRRIRAAGQ